MLPSNCSAFLSAVAQVVEAKHVEVGNLMEKNIYFFLLVHKKREDVFSQKYSK